jgi:hypothetical protein
MRLPLRHQGLGIISLCENADSSYVGTVIKNLPKLSKEIPNFSPEDLPGLINAHKKLATLFDRREGRLRRHDRRD